MTEILFRGKRIDNGEWVEGSLIIDHYDYAGQHKDRYVIQNCLYRIDENGFCDFQSGISEDIDPLTLGQYTGLTDRNGRKIFEGDIVQKDDGPFRGVHGVCHYGTNDDTCIGYYIRWIDDGENRWSEWWRQDLGYWNDKVTIIGNIHDNSELLRGQGK